MFSQIFDKARALAYAISHPMSGHPNPPVGPVALEKEISAAAATAAAAAVVSRSSCARVAVTLWTGSFE